MITSDNPWFLAQDDCSDRARRQLVCFPYAGGSAAVFKGWQAALGPEFEVLAVELPGRGTRFAESPVASLNVLVARLAVVAADVLRDDCVFFGHSNGALIAYALSCELARQRLPMPGRLVVSAKKPPHLDRSRELHALALPELVAELRVLNGTPPELLDDPELLEIFAPILRADFALSERYDHPFDVPPLPCAATLIGGRDDTHAPPGDVYAWQEYFAGRVEKHCLLGDHFFIHELRDEVLDIVRAALRTPAPSSQPLRQPRHSVPLKNRSNIV